MPNFADPTDRHQRIKALFDEYIEMYAARDEQLTSHFSDNFSGFTGGGDFLVKDRQAWQAITRQDFAQVPERVRIEMLDFMSQDLSPEVVMCTAFFHIHLPIPDQVLSSEVARLVLVMRLEGDLWKIVHSGISIPYHLVKNGEVFPLAGLLERNQALEALVAERTRALHVSEALYRSLAEDTQDVLWQTDRHLLVTYISPVDEILRGFKAEEVLGHSVFEMFSEAGAAHVKSIIRQNLQARSEGQRRQFSSFEVEHCCKDGRLIWGEVRSRPELDAQGEIVGYHGITREITKRKLLEDQVRQLAFFDPLTHLANRRLLSDRVSQAQMVGKRSGCFGALMFMDLDNFKPLNDLHGHAVGDLLLLEVANRLLSCLRQVDTVSRFGGDEFVVLLSELTSDQEQSVQQARALAEKIRLRLCEPYLLTVIPEGASAKVVEHHCSASIGLVVFHGDSEKDVIRIADTAMYQAKATGRNSICFVTAGSLPWPRSAADQISKTIAHCRLNTGATS